MYSCDCWKLRDMKPEYIEERRKEIEEKNIPAYWGQKTPFEHDAFELFAHAMSPEEFIKKWKPHVNQEDLIWL